MCVGVCVCVCCVSVCVGECYRLKKKVLLFTKSPSKRRKNTASRCNFSDQLDIRNPFAILPRAVTGASFEMYQAQGLRQMVSELDTLTADSLDTMFFSWDFSFLSLSL